jgi:putative component of membrane protein insertase Oxa1/YidC/SpoIIIJ protein YidD
MFRFLFLLILLLVRLGLGFAQERAIAERSLVGFYQRHISGIRGTSCPMHPSCSNYGWMALNQEGVVAGTFLIFDRLLRCGHDRVHYAITLTEKGYRLFDSTNLALNIAEFKVSASSLDRIFAIRDTIPDISNERFIADLISDGFYSEALIEIRRRMYLDSVISSELQVNYLRVQIALGKEEQAIYYYEVTMADSVRRNSDTRYTMAQAWNRLGSYQKELVYLRAIQDDDPQYRSQSIYKLQVNALAHLGQYQEALDYLGMTDNYGFAGEDPTGALEELRDFRPKSPFLGGTLNVIPGLGYYYAGHKGTAVSALALNSLLIFATLSNHKQGNAGMTTLTGIFAVSFYLSGIDGGIKAVKRSNEASKARLLSKLKYPY